MPTRVHVLPGLAACSPNAAYQTLLMQMTSWAALWVVSGSSTQRRLRMIHRRKFWAGAVKLVR